jgi:hypothetical protein
MVVIAADVCVEGTWLVRGDSLPSTTEAHVRRQLLQSGLIKEEMADSPEHEDAVETRADLR